MRTSVFRNFETLCRVYFKFPESRTVVRLILPSVHAICFVPLIIIAKIIVFPIVFRFKSSINIQLSPYCIYTTFDQIGNLVDRQTCFVGCLNNRFPNRSAFVLYAQISLLNCVMSALWAIVTISVIVERPSKFGGAYLGQGRQNQTDPGLPDDHMHTADL